MIKKEVTPVTPLKKEVTSNTTVTKPTAPVTPVKKGTQNNASTQKVVKKEIPYKYVGKETLAEIIGKLIPKQFIPTQRTGKIFGGVFVVVMIIALFQSPLTSMMSGSTDLTFNIGYPLIFLELELNAQEGGPSPLRIGNLILDILIYILLSYVIDVAISLILRNPLIQSEEEKKQIPVVFRHKEISLAEKATKAIGKPK